MILPYHIPTKSNHFLSKESGSSARRRRKEAKFILGQFERYELKFKGDTELFICDMEEKKTCSVRELFWLRDIYQRKRKIFDAS